MPISLYAFNQKYQHTAYGVSKAGFIQMNEDMRRLFPSLSIKSVVYDTVVAEEDNIFLGCNLSMKKGILKRKAIPEELAAVVAFISSESGKMIKNTKILANGYEEL